MDSQSDIPVNRFRGRGGLYLGSDGRLYCHAAGEDCLLFSRLYRPSAERTRERLLDLRQRTGWSRATTAALLGVPKHTLRRWEEGKRQPCAAAHKLIWVMHALYTAPDELLTLENVILWGHGTKAILLREV